MKRIFTLFTLLATSLAAEDNFPKTGLVLWLNAGNAEVQDGVVEQLTDLSGKGHHAQHDRAAKSVLTNPVVVKELLNGQPVLRFSGANSSFTFNEITNIRTIFWVVSKDAQAFKQKQELFVLGGSKSLDFHPGTHFTDTILHATTKYGAPALQQGKAWLNGKPIDARATDFPQTLSVITLESTANVRANQLAKDRQFPDRCWRGDIAEILLFDAPLSDADRQAVEKHLMTKFGILSN